MNLYEELKEMAKYFEKLEHQYAADAGKYCDQIASGKSSAYNNAAGEIYDVLWKYEEENNLEKS